MVNYLRVAASRARCLVLLASRYRSTTASPTILQTADRCIFKEEIRRFHSSSTVHADIPDGPSAIDYSSSLPENEFHKICNETLEHLQEKIEEYGDKHTIDGFDTNYSEGVLTVRLGDLGTYVINKQTPNRQIWLSSPVSGPARFDWINSKWVYRRAKTELYSLLQKEFQELISQPLDLSQG